MERKTKNDYEKLGRQAGFEWISVELPTDMLEKTRWRCAHGHEFDMRGANVHLAVMHPGSRGCPYCSHRWRRTGADYHRLAKQHEVEWVGGDVPQNTREKTPWRLPDGQTRHESYRTLAARVTKLGNPQLRVERR